MDAVEKIAAAVLYEGYVLWPYRRSAHKNRQRWTLGGVYPRAFSEAGPGSDPWQMQTQCLVCGASPSVRVRVRFLQVVERRVGRYNGEGLVEFVDELQVDDERYLAWEEAAEREIAIENLNLAELRPPCTTAVTVSAGRDDEQLKDSTGDLVGVLVRHWQMLQGAVEIGAERLEENLFRLTVRICNTTPWYGEPREGALRQSFASTHSILSVAGGEFVSLLEPPNALKTWARQCENIKTWPVLAGVPGERSTLLSSPISLYDYPQVAPESAGDYFDGGETDQLLLLNILTLTDEEKAEMRATDPRVREILERGEALTAEEFMHLHGAIREFQMLDEAASDDSFASLRELEKPLPLSVLVDGVEVRKGSRVRLCPRIGGDIMDIVLVGKVAIVEGIDQDDSGRIHLSVVIEDDPGRDLGAARVPGHRFFFSPEEVEPLIEPSKATE